MSSKQTRWGPTAWGAAAMALALALPLIASDARAEELTRWILVGSEPDGSMALYAEQGSYARILDRGAPSLRMVVKMSGRLGQDDYRQLIFPEALCAKGSGSIDRYTIDGLAYLGSSPAERPRPGGRSKNGDKAGYDDIAAESMCQAYEASLPSRPAMATEAPGPGSKSSLYDRLKAVLQ